MAQTGPQVEQPVKSSRRCDLPKVHEKERAEVSRTNEQCSQATQQVKIRETVIQFGGPRRCETNDYGTFLKAETLKSGAGFAEFGDHARKECVVNDRRGIFLCPCS